MTYGAEQESVDVANSRNLANFFIGLGVGLLLGSALGLLYAPKAGVEIRGEIKERAAVLAEKGKQGYGVAKEKVSGLADSVRERLHREGAGEEASTEA